MPYKNSDVTYSEKKELQNGFKEYLDSWNWDLFITLTFKKNPISFNDAYENYVKKYFKYIKKQFKKTAFGVFTVALIDKGNLNNTIHIHSLLTSNPNYPVSFNKLSDFELFKMATWWEYGRVTIDKVYDKEGINKYIAEKNTRFDNCDKHELFYFRQNLLKEFKNKEKGAFV